MELSINPNTIQRGYAKLEEQGYIYSVAGKGSFVSDNKELIECKKIEILEEISELLKQARDIGIEKDKLFIVINKEYKGRDKA